MSRLYNLTVTLCKPLSGGRNFNFNDLDISYQIFWYFAIIYNFNLGHNMFSLQIHNTITFLLTDKWLE